MKFNCAVLIAVLMPLTSFAQTFDSTSNGKDGDLTYTTPGTYVFDPKTFTPPLNPAGDNIYNFKTITIAAGVTVKLSGSVFDAPVVWLAQGAVKIDGTIDLSGQDGFIASSTTQRTLTIPGAGGYGGGYPAVGANPAGAGLGPLPGATGGGCSGDRQGGFSGNQFLVPLIGGSGGGGAGPDAGGAGGGAILIASSVSISGTGSIKANGGANHWDNVTGLDLSGAGAGGAIRLVAPSVTLNGSLNAAGGGNFQCGTAAAAGVVRIEAFQIGSISVSGGNYYTATPYSLFLSPTGIPSIRVVSVGGVMVNNPPTGGFTMPDVTINSNAPVPVMVQATNVPLGTMVTLQIFSENGPDQSPSSTIGLAGTLASSTATIMVPLPSGFSKGFVKATFTQQ